MPAVRSASPKLRICSVNVVKNSQNAEILIELQVVEVVRFRTREEREMVARVGVERRHKRNGEPAPATCRPFNDIFNYQTKINILLKFFNINCLLPIELMIVVTY